MNATVSAWISLQERVGSILLIISYRVSSLQLSIISYLKINEPTSLIYFSRITDPSP